MKRISMNIAEELHKRFKIACVNEGKEMTEVVVRAIRDFVERSEKKPKK